MHGNVAEWVIDRYDRNGYPYYVDMVANPFQLGEVLYPRVVRGGSYKDIPARLRSAARGGHGQRAVFLLQHRHSAAASRGS